MQYTPRATRTLVNTRPAREHYQQALGLGRVTSPELFPHTKLSHTYIYISI